MTHLLAFYLGGVAFGLIIGSTLRWDRRIVAALLWPVFMGTMLALEVFPRK